MAGLVASNLVLSQTTGGADHVDYYFGLGGSALGLVTLLIGPAGEMGRLARMRATLDAARSAGGGADLCVAARSAERELAEVARLEARARSWIVHLATLW
jgi:hypothetical protein